MTTWCNMRFIVTIPSAIGLSACGSLASNTDVPQGVYLGAGDKPAIVDEPTVRMISGSPPPGVVGVAVSGTSCKNKLWEPAPTREIAISVLKRETKKAGMNAVYLLAVGDDPSALSKNCWAAITASGVATNVR